MEWLKQYSNWPSFPQIYIQQKFIGGTEIVLKMIERDEFMTLVPPECIRENALEKFQNSLKQNVVVLFLKGTPDRPGDGYQKVAVEALNSIQCNYSHVDVTANGDLRELVKDYTRWNSFPQLFIRSKFAGGGNFIVEGAKSGRIFDVIPTTEILLPVREKIHKLVEKGIYMMFMHGTPKYPHCQASRGMVELLWKYPWVLQNRTKPELELEYFDLNNDQGMKSQLAFHTKFGEVPQLYVDG